MTETEVMRLDELAKKLYVIVAVIFTLMDVKGNSESKQQQPCYFC